MPGRPFITFNPMKEGLRLLAFHSSRPVVLAHQGFLDKIYGHDAPGEGGLGTLGHKELMKGEHFKICICATCSMTFHPLQELVRSRGVVETLSQHG